MTDKTKPLRRWTGPSGQRYELWPELPGRRCYECRLSFGRVRLGDCKGAPCARAIVRLPSDPPSWAKEQK